MRGSAVTLPGLSRSLAGGAGSAVRSGRRTLRRSARDCSRDHSAGRRRQPRPLDSAADGVCPVLHLARCDHSPIVAASGYLKRPFGVRLGLPASELASDPEHPYILTTHTSLAHWTGQAERSDPTPSDRMPDVVRSQQLAAPAGAGVPSQSRNRAGVGMTTPALAGLVGCSRPAAW